MASGNFPKPFVIIIGAIHPIGSNFPAITVTADVENGCYRFSANGSWSKGNKVAVIRFRCKNLICRGVNISVETHICAIMAHKCVNKAIRLAAVSCRVGNRPPIASIVVKLIIRIIYIKIKISACLSGVAIIRRWAAIPGDDGGAGCGRNRRIRAFDRKIHISMIGRQILRVRIIALGDGLKPFRVFKTEPYIIRNS